MTTEQIELPQYHPALPSIEGAKNDYNQFFSDHVPILARIPIDKSKSGELVLSEDLEEIKILSWNVMQNDSFNGVAPLGKTSFGETIEQREARHDRIAEALEKLISQQDPDFITLQEITTNSDDQISLIKKIQEKIDNSYSCARFKNNTVNGYDNITFYKNNKFKLTIDENKYKTVQDLKVPKLLGHKTMYTPKTNPEFKIRIANVHPSFNENPATRHEPAIKAFLQEKEAEEDNNTLSIVVGDLNCSLRKLELDNDTHQNITTSVTPSIFRDDKTQGACAIDGSFYLQQFTNTGDNNSNNEEPIYHQADIEHLNPNTGEIYSTSDLAPITIPEQFSRNNEKVALMEKEINELRMVISLDPRLNTVQQLAIPTPTSSLNIMDYENDLRTKFKTKNITVRYATTINNQSGLGIALGEDALPLSAYLTKAINNNSYPFIQYKETNDPFTDEDTVIFYVKWNNIAIFKSIIDEYFNTIYEKKLWALRRKIDNIYKMDNNKMPNKDKIVDAFEQLYDHLNNKFTVHASNTRNIIIDHFTAEAEATCKNPNRSVKEIEASAKKLDEKLYGKPPMNTLLKITIAAVIGALVGAALGFVVAASITAWHAGFGAIPAAIIASTKGFTVGTQCFTEGIGLGMLAGGAIGFFHGRKKQRDFKDSNYVIMANNNIYKKIQTITAVLKDDGLSLAPSTK